jgi:hypothetical protein
LELHNPKQPVLNLLLQPLDHNPLPQLPDPNPLLKRSNHNLFNNPDFPDNQISLSPSLATPLHSDHNKSNNPLHSDHNKSNLNLQLHLPPQSSPDPRLPQPLLKHLVNLLHLLLHPQPHHAPQHLHPHLKHVLHLLHNKCVLNPLLRCNLVSNPFNKLWFPKLFKPDLKCHHNHKPHKTVHSRLLPVVYPHNSQLVDPNKYPVDHNRVNLDLLPHFSVNPLAVHNNWAFPKAPARNSWVCHPNLFNSKVGVSNPLTVLLLVLLNNAPRRLPSLTPLP